MGNYYPDWQPRSARLCLIGNVQAGDEVVLMGRDANEEVSCAELAERGDTITWEIITRIGSRVRRVYV